MTTTSGAGPVSSTIVTPVRSVRMSPLLSSAHRAPGYRSARYDAVSAGAVNTSSALTGNPASTSVEATQARVRDVVLVSNATARPISRSRVTASTAHGIGRHDTVSTPS